MAKSERHHQSGEKAQGSSHAGRSAQIPGWYDGMHEVPGQADKIPNGSNRQQDSRESLCGLLIDEEGSVAEAKVTKSVHPLLDEESLRVAGLLQKFEPAMFQGKPVCAYFDFPVTFHVN